MANKQKPNEIVPELIRYPPPNNAIFSVSFDVLLSLVIELVARPISQDEMLNSMSCVSEGEHNQLDGSVDDFTDATPHGVPAITAEKCTDLERLRPAVSNFDRISNACPSPPSETLKSQLVDYKKTKSCDNLIRLESRLSWEWRKGAGSILTSIFATSGTMPVQFVPRVEGGSRGCVVPDHFGKAKQMYKTIRCAYFCNPADGVPPCFAKLKLVFYVYKGDEYKAGHEQQREIRVIWLKGEKSRKSVCCVHQKGAVAKVITRFLDRERLANISPTASGMTFASVTKSTALRIELVIVLAHMCQYDYQHGYPLYPVLLIMQHMFMP